jgi:hypothetical protein
MDTEAPRRRGDAKERILQLAEAAVLEKGFAGTSIDELFARADALNEDPLHGFLVGLKMLADLMGELPTGHPGCLIAAYCYQDRLFDQQVRDLNAQAVLAWRTRFRARLDLIAARYPPRRDVDLDDLADMLSAVADGGIILSKVLKDKNALPRQIMLYRGYVRAVFLGA